MRENNIRRLWADGRTAVNGWLAIPSTFSAETMAHQGWDSLCIDLQHGVNDYLKAVDMLTAISTTDTVPLVRVPWLEEGIIMKMLDAGAYGIICPMINSREECERFVAATSYPPMGRRSNGPVRALLYAGSDYQAHANDTILRFAMIETAEGLNNLDEIMSVPGLDAVYIGPSDLSLALGCRPVFDDLDPPAAAAVERILAKAKEHGIDPKEFVAAWDALAVYAHKDNPLDTISMEDLEQIYADGGSISSWKQVHGFPKE